MDTNNNENIEKEVTTEVVNNEVSNVEEVKVENETKVDDIPNVVVEDAKKETPKKKNKTLPIILCFIGVICLGIGIFLSLTSEEESSDKNNGTVEENKDKEENKENNNTAISIKDFVDYTKYDMNATMSMASEGVTMDAVENGRFDTLNNVYYSEATVFGMTVYSYYDINNHLIYSSSDKLEWEKETDNEISLPVFPGTVIGKVKNNEGVTDLGNGKYSLTMDTLELPDMEEYSGKIPTTVTFDSNGYLSEIVLDMTAIYAEDGVTSSTVTYKFSNVNSGDSVTIPADVVNNAVESDW